MDQVPLQRGAGRVQGPNLGAKLAPRGALDEAKGGNLAKTSRKWRFWKAHWMGQWAPLEQGWGSSVRKPTEMRPRRGQNEHPWPPKTLTIAGEVLRKSMLEALRQKLWPRALPRAALEEPRGPTLQNHREYCGFEDLSGGGYCLRRACNCPISDAGGSPEGYLKVSKDGYLQVSSSAEAVHRNCGMRCLGFHTPWAAGPANLSLDCPDLQFPVKQGTKEMSRPVSGSWKL